MATAILINGPVASGKSTVASALVARVPGAVLIEGDDHIPNVAGLSREARWALALDGIAAQLREVLAAGRPVAVAWPLTEDAFRRLVATAHDAGGEAVCITLAPPLASVLTGRGRKLTPAECGRIREMYAEGYASRPFSDLVIDGSPTPDEAADEIIALLRNRC
jgi:hypothetical protein